MYSPPHPRSCLQRHFCDEVDNTFWNTYLWIVGRTQCYLRLNPGVNCSGAMNKIEEFSYMNWQKYINLTLLTFQSLFLYSRTWGYATAVHPWVQPEVAMSPGRYPKMSIPKCILHLITAMSLKTWSWTVRRPTEATLLRRSEKTVKMPMIVGIRYLINLELY